MSSTNMRRSSAPTLSMAISTHWKNKMFDLGQESVNDPKLGMKDIRAFLRGDDPTGELDKGVMSRLSLGEVKDYFQNRNKILDNKNFYEEKKKGKDYKDEVQELKNKKHLMRLQKEDNDEEIMNLLKELEKAKEKDLRAAIDKEEIKQALKDMDSTALTHADRQKRRELEKLSGERENLRIREQQMLDEIKKMEESMYRQEKQFRKEADEIRKENNDDVFAVNELKKKELEMAKERGDHVVKLQHQRKMYEKERNEIMRKLDQITKGVMPKDRPRSGLSAVGNDIMGNSNGFDRDDIDPAMKDKLIAEQVKINHLREQQQKTNEELMDMDQIDLLENEVSNKNRNNYPKTQMSPFKPSAPPSFNQNRLPAGIKTSVPQYGNNRENLADDIQDLSKTYVNNGGDDPNFIKKVNDLNDFVKNRAPPKVQDRLGVENHETKVADHPMPPAPMMPYGGVPPYGYPPGYPPAPPPAFGHPYGMPYPPPDPYANNPNLQYMDNMVRQIQEENKKLEEELEKVKNDDYNYDSLEQHMNMDVDALKQQLLPNGASAAEEPFPEDFVFRQNDFRSEDLEVEERALMNIASQEYDHLRLLSRLPTNSELYRYKMDQYKELSTMRAEIEKVLQEQRLEKIRRDYEKAKYEDERRYNHERWIEEQKREILAAKLRNQAEGRTQNYDQPQYDHPQYNEPPPQTQNYYDNTANQMPPPTGQFPPKTAHVGTAGGQNDEKIYDPKVGFLTFFDTVARIPRQHKGMQIVYGWYNNGRSLTDNRMVTVQDWEQDPEAPEMNRVVYDIGHQVKNIQPHPSSNLIIECQVPDNSRDGGPGKFKFYAWTVINLFDYTYDFHVGEFKLPLYSGQTLADIDTRDINTLKPLDDTFLCMRMAIPGDDIATSQYLPEKSTQEYRVPSIHQVQYIEQPFEENDNFGIPREPTYPQDQNAPIPQNRGPQRKMPTEKDPFYRCNGINVFVHYVKQFPSQSAIKVGATILEENNVVRIGHDQLECNWASNPVDAGKVLMAKWKNTNAVQPDGAPIIDRTKPEEDQYVVGNKEIGYNPDSEDILIPINNEVSWEHDFYKHLWDKNLRNELFLVVTLLEASVGLDKRIHPSSHEYSTVGYGSIKLNNPDGTIRFGTFDVTLYAPPAKIRNHDSDKRMKSSIKITVSQPLPSMPKMDPYKNNPLKPNAGPDPQIPKIVPPPNRPQNEAPFIPNDRDQYTDELYDKKDWVDFYLDSGRFLPENSSYCRVVVNWVNHKGKQIIKPITIPPDISDSVVSEPFYGSRHEIREKLEPTCLLVFTLDTFDLSSGGTSIVGHACFPLFLDDRTKSYVQNPKTTNYILQNGCYQIPIYMQFPNDIKNLTYDSFKDLERIPGASLLIRIKKPTKDAKGKPISLSSIKELDKARELGAIDTPSPYSDGIFNTTYYPISSTETVIMEAKLQRSQIRYVDIMGALATQQTGEETKMNEEELQQFWEKKIMAKSLSSFSDLARMTYLDPKFFSEYIPQLGFTATVDFIVNPPLKSLFYVVMSLVPPGRLYRSKKENLPLSETRAATDVQAVFRLNYESPAKAISFVDGIKQFYVTKPRESSLMIYQLFEVKLGNNAIHTIVPFGFSFVPIYQYVDADASGQNEIYINTSIQQLLVFKGKPDEDLIIKLSSTQNIIRFIDDNIKNKSLEPVPKMSMVIKLIDNQFENIFKEPYTAYDRMKQTYMMIKNPKNFKFNYEKDFYKNKSAQIKKMFGKKYTQEDYEKQVYDYVEANTN